MDDVTQFLIRHGGSVLFAVVLAEQGNILGVCFHPELTEDTRLHEYFLRRIQTYREGA